MNFYYDIVELKNMVKRLAQRINVLLTNPLGLSETTGLPTLPPANNYQKVKIDLATGMLYYFDSDTSTWGVATPSGDTHMANTDLVFTGSRTYDGANSTITYNDVSSLDFNTIGAAGVQLTNDTNGLDYSALEIASGRVDLVTSAFGSTVSHLNLSGTEVVIGNAGGAYFLGDGFLTIPPTLDNAQDQIIAIDESTGRLYRRTVASIGGGADTNFAANDLTLTANRTHTGSNLRSLTIQNLTALTLNTGISNQEILLDNTGNGIRLLSDSSISHSVDLGGGVTGSIGVTGGQASFTVDAGAQNNGILLYPGLLGVQLRDSEGYYNFDATGGSLLPSLDDVGEPFEGLSDKMLTVDANGRILRKPLAGADTNFGNTDITFTGDRTHDVDGYNLEISNAANLNIFPSNNFDLKINTGGADVAQLAGNTAGYVYISSSDGAGALSSVSADYTLGVSLYNAAGIYSITGLPTYADDTAAGAGGLATGRIYKTSAGVMMVKL